jgi:type I restriction enzyme S subunit
MHSRVPVAYLSTRLDCAFYDPNALASEELLANFGSLKRLAEIIDPGRQITNGVRGPELESSPYKLVRLQDCKDWTIDFDECLTISERQFFQNRRCRLREGDVVVAIGGYIGNASVARNAPPAVIGQHSAVLPRDPKGGTDEGYLVAYLNSGIGAVQFQRYVSGTVQQGINLEDLREVPIPLPSRLVQSYIGDKVRQAERLRERGRRCERETQQYFCLPETNGKRVGALRSYRTNRMYLRSDRLDAAYYDPAHLRLAEFLGGRGAQPLSSVARQIHTRWQKISDEFLYLEIGTIDLGSGTITPERCLTSEASSRAQRVVEPWDVLVATVRPGRKNVAIVPENASGLPIVASTGFSVLRFESREAAVFYHAWLRSDAATQQLMQWNAGGTYPAIEDGIAINTLVPPFLPDVVQDQGRRWLMKFDGVEHAQRLTTAAKLLVEALVEGKVSEADLKEAHEALQRGDQVPDRAILSCLTRKGIDCPNEPPLFLDLDALYTALGQVNHEPSKPTE